MSDPLHDPYSSPRATQEAAPRTSPPPKAPAWRKNANALVGSIWGGAMLLALLTWGFIATSFHLSDTIHLVWPLLAICWILLPVVSIRGSRALWSSNSRTEKFGIVVSIILAPFVAYGLVGIATIFALHIGIC
ncbi:MAG: hypothetical protein QM755_12475 [Luteolibacter sp.]